MPIVKFYTLGCKVNQYETQAIRERFLGKGYKEIYNGIPADFCLINTCTVTAAADAKCRNLIRSAIKENPSARIIVTGCLIEKDRRAVADIKGVDLIIPKSLFPQRISKFCGHTRAFLKVQDGCDNFCSYCKVPLVRGRPRSKNLGQIAQEAQALVKNGLKEIVLCGICLGAYGKDLIPKLNLVDVIKELEKIDGLLRIRLSSIEAGDVPEELIARMAQSKKLCPHLHIPIQSGDDEILKKMNRKYSRRDYLELIRKIKKRIPGVAITTDVLVGFPGETEKNFKQTVDLVKKILPLKVHIFPYSPRKGTPADAFRERINPAIIKERIQRLRGVADNCVAIYKKRFAGKKMAVLIERQCQDNPDFWEGYTDNYIKVRIKSGRNLQNQLVSLNLTKQKIS